jgi:tripartite-type tricarboxylate transporter receptor subunit TctC
MTRAFRALSLAITLGVVFGAVHVAAQEAYPTKPIRLVVPYPPGATSDNVGRIVAAKLAEALGQPVIVDNRPGAGGTIGTDHVARSAPDGYTLLSATSAFMAIAPQVIPVKYDPVKDFEPISLVGDAYSVLAVHPSLPARTVREFVDLSKRTPGSLNFGSAGNGSATHLFGEVFKMLTAADLTHVPYKGSAPAITDLIAGRLQAMFDPATLPHIQAGKLRALAVTTGTRWPALPDVPTMAESGVNGFNARLWFAVAGPAGLPPHIVKTLNAHLVRILARDDTKEALARVAIRAESSSPAALAERIREDIAFFAKVVKAANIKAD